MIDIASLVVIMGDGNQYVIDRALIMGITITGGMGPTEITIRLIAPDMMYRSSESYGTWVENDPPILESRHKHLQLKAK